jgi:hypothetical protein
MAYRHNTAVMPAKAGIQYAAPPPLITSVSECWIIRVRG